MTTQKQHIEALEQRVLELEKRLPRQHGTENKPQHQRTSFLNSEAAALPELTPDETAFLQKHGFSPEERTIPLQIHLQSLSSKDKRTLSSLKQKRAVRCTFQH